MSGTEAITAKVCPDCGAELGPAAQTCWLCRKPLPYYGEVVLAELVPEARRFDALETLLAVSTLIIVGVMVLVGIGCLVAQPGLGLVYLLFVAPPLLFTLLRSQQRRAASEQTSWADHLLTLMLSTAVSAAVAGLLCLAAFVAFFVWCWYAILTS